jgi:carbon-monoxide dehydrogenase iron sulfur subunit
MRSVLANPERCIGCRQCMYACAVEHSASRDPTLAPFEDPLPRSRIHVEAGPAFGTSFPNRCRHCNPAPCRGACPSGAITRDDGLDVVLVDARRCIACAMCAMVCPFDAVTFHETRTDGATRIVATKCDGCAERVRNGGIPACVEACKTGALVYGEINELVRQRRAHRTSILLNGAPAPERPVPPTLAGLRAWGEEATILVQRLAEETVS